ncbi:MAG: TIGR04282 family arsenosugar biosynthesis glycosyltransferase [Ignavibacteria bacterium]|nr:TIGR04282 family arsenosugar biosynthesis glycosyltransferase [Ignavibacteria bacterium]MBT8391078.1 TIGR04282 family arsenosugar biosynthesis glycosyltransferase [Ignavibacteria bacterium]NNJ54447.1 glycosyltransferase [Ignavibacteriaceae bacterium]NNL21864.1 glycosyltransferase [Ignavibacteriaceae bacterium]
MSNECAIIIFAKFPDKGFVKTRLAKDLGEEFATEFYRVCAEHIFSEVLKINSNTLKPFIFCVGEKEVKKVYEWAKKKFIVRPQIDSDLGRRMSVSFKKCFSEGYTKAIIIGTDIPDISTEIIEKAFSTLNNYDCVLGPSSDGGYYLLGMNNFYPEIFEGIEWSTSTVTQKTLEKINSLNLQSKLLNELIDVDTKKDLDKWVRSCIELTNPVYKFVSNYFQKKYRD